jgi:hypothetical protein
MSSIHYKMKSEPNFVSIVLWIFFFSWFFIYSKTCPCDHLYQAVTCIKRSPFSCPVIDNFIWIEPLLRGHLSYKTTSSLFQRWPLNTGLSVLGNISFLDHTLNIPYHDLIPPVPIKLFSFSGLFKTNSFLQILLQNGR